MKIKTLSGRELKNKTRVDHNSKQRPPVKVKPEKLSKLKSTPVNIIHNSPSHSSKQRLNIPAMVKSESILSVPEKQSMYRFARWDLSNMFTVWNYTSSLNRSLRLYKHYLWRNCEKNCGPV